MDLETIHRIELGIPDERMLAPRLVEHVGPNKSDPFALFPDSY